METFILEMLEDDRFFENAGEMLELVYEELDFLVDLPHYVWRRSADVIRDQELEVQTLRHETLHCALVSVGYLWRDGFRSLEQWPEKLTQGDFDATLREVAFLEEPLPRSRIVRQIRFLLDLHMPRGPIKDGLRLYRSAPGSIGIVEKDHKSAALYIKSHREYDESQLCARSVINALYQTLTPDKADANIARLKKELDAKMTGIAGRGGHNARSVYISQLSANKLGVAEGATGKQKQQSVLRGAAATFKELPGEVVESFQKQAHRLNLKRKADMMSEQVSLRNLIDLEESRRQHLLSEPPNTVKSAKVREAAISSLQAWWENIQKDPALQETVLAKVQVSAPDVPRPLDQEQNLQVQEELAEDGGDTPFWIRWLSRHRFAWRNCFRFAIPAEALLRSST